ncbi:hypothetical protein PG996_006442 [Apiospora saccharicola]|uniref:3'-5' exonuclease domain-containing protein n=1 Tax=Apiospora saccharicola TaxID=335842 RepID=A0ABR1VPD0_9PEZI
MIWLKPFGFGARSSALRIWSRAIQEQHNVLHRRVSTKAAAALARAANTKKPTFFVDTPAGVSEVADRLRAQGPGSELYADIEGQRLSRHGAISLIVIYSSSARQAFVLDISILKRAAFKPKGSRGLNIQQILQSTAYRKIFFDVRNDADALFHQFGVALQRVEDLQLIESAARPDNDPSRNRSRGLAKCLETVLSSVEKKEWAKSKKAGHALFDPKSGGSYAVFEKRPLSPEILAYCVGDVFYLPRLREKHWDKLSKSSRKRVMRESKARVLESQQQDFKANSPKTSKRLRQRDKHRAMEIEFGGLSVEWWDGLDDILAWENRHLH